MATTDGLSRKMIRRTDGHVRVSFWFFVCIGTVITSASHVCCQSTTTTATTTVASNATTISSNSTSGNNTNTTTTSTTTTTTTTTLPPPTTSTDNNATWLIIGVVAAVFFVVVSVIVVAVAYTVHQKKKRVHPHSDTKTIYDEPEDHLKTRPTTASHIFFDHADEEEEAMSKPVTMSTFELRKLYVETFPYSNWKKSFNGTLRPHMNLEFVDPKVYRQTRGAEQQFREKIINYEMPSDTLTLRSTAVSRLARAPYNHQLPPLAEVEANVHTPNVRQKVNRD